MRGQTGTKHDTIPGFGERLRQIMDEEQISQSELARRVGISPSSVFQYLTADGIPSLPNAARIADALSVSLDWLCGTRKVNADSADTYRLKRIAESVVEGTRDTYACIQTLNKCARALAKWAEKYQINLEEEQG